MQANPNIPPEQIPHPLESEMEAMILQNEELKEQWSETNALLEAIALQTQENDPEPILWAMIENDNQNTEKLVWAIKELKPELEKSASSSDRMVNFLEQMKWEKGDKPTQEELIALIEPRIPKPIKWEKWDIWPQWVPWRNPIHSGKTPPKNPIKWDLWYQN